MNEEKALALRLADALGLHYAHLTAVPEINRQAAAELRRLHAENAELLETLKLAKWMLERDYVDPQKMAVIEKCDDAIAKAEGRS